MPGEEKTRASPEALLALASREGRGRLKIFLGAAPGVGKTYAMLTAARSEKAGGRDVVIAGGVSTLRHYLTTGAVDMLHLQIAPIVLGAGECLWHGLTATLEPTGARQTRFTTHMDYRVAKA